MSTAADVVRSFRTIAKEDQAEKFKRFFKTEPGQYGEGDKFLGVSVPQQRAIAKEHLELSIVEIEKLLDSDWHEVRLTGIFILVRQFEKSKKSQKDRQTIYECFFRKIDRVNNWDLVDSSAYKLVGAYLESRSRKPLYKLAKSKHLWKNRIAIVATLWFIKQDDFEDTIEISKLLLDHRHDLIHKAVGWMLREMGKRNEDLLLGFLDEHAGDMPRTALRYAIEKLSPPMRQKYLEHGK